MTYCTIQKGFKCIPIAVILNTKRILLKNMQQKEQSSQKKKKKKTKAYKYLITQ